MLKRKKSLISIIIIGIKKNKLFFFEYDPKNKPTAPMAVKLGGCGINLDRIPTIVKTIIDKINLLEKMFFMVSLKLMKLNFI